MFMVFLDITIVGVALPSIGRDLGATDGLEWVISGYLMALGVAQPATGWLAARFGARQALLVALGLFVLSSMAAGAAPTLPVLIVARALQGMAGGLLVPLSTTILYAVFPPERRGTVIGLSGMVIMAAPAAGPLISGYVLTFASWRWLMLVNVPVGIGAILAGSRTIPDVGEREQRPFDVPGLVMIGSGLALFLYGFSESEGAGWSAPSVLLMMVIGATLLGAYGVWAARAERPLVDLSIFRQRAFTLAVAIAWAVSLAQIGRTVFMPVELQVVWGMTSLEAGAALALSGVASAIVMPLAGRWTDRGGGRAPALLGTVLLGIATARLATLSLETPVWHVLGAISLIGFGIVLVTIPTTLIALNAVPEQLVPEAASVRSLNREVAGAVSTTVLAAVIATRAGSIAADIGNSAALAHQQEAYNSAFLMAFLGVVAALLLALNLPRRTRDEPSR